MQNSSGKRCLMLATIIVCSNHVIVVCITIKLVGVYGVDPEASWPLEWYEGGASGVICQWHHGWEVSWIDPQRVQYLEVKVWGKLGKNWNYALLEELRLKENWEHLNWFTRRFQEFVRKDQHGDKRKPHLIQESTWEIGMVIVQITSWASSWQ